MKREHKDEPDQWCNARLDKKLKITLEKPPVDPRGDAVRAACRRGPLDEYSNQPVLIRGLDFNEEHLETLAYWPADEKIGRALLDNIESELWQFERGDIGPMASSATTSCYSNVAEALFYVGDELERGGADSELHHPGIIYQLCRTLDVDAPHDLGTLRILSVDPVPEKFLHSRVYRGGLAAHLHTIEVFPTGCDECS